ncbi:hypothetical protein MTR67_035869 [Solanum verrucosum]|uniref:Uncharacterized protein n=1 Tax=Solanum verrucosum TaxID=315347 RepID=A0AAF0ZMP7_SOLVR|nr:hypothetical protein MTR67_035869 [Solanum verrucosum]
MKRPNYPSKIRIWTFLNPTTQLSKGITYSYELGIAQTRRHWKDHSKSFPTISESIPNLS